MCEVSFQVFDEWPGLEPVPAVRYANSSRMLAY